MGLRNIPKEGASQQEPGGWKECEAGLGVQCVSSRQAWQGDACILVCTVVYPLPFPKAHVRAHPDSEATKSPSLGSSQVRTSLDTSVVQTPKYYLSNPSPTPMFFFLLSRGLDADSSSHLRAFASPSAASSGTSFLDSACICLLTTEVLAQLTQPSSNPCPTEFLTALHRLVLSFHVSQHTGAGTGDHFFWNTSLLRAGDCVTCYSDS